MSFFGGHKPPTHEGVPMDAVMPLARQVGARFRGAEVTRAGLAEMAAEIDVPVAHLYVAAAMMQLPFESNADSRFVLCLGGCQSWGALERLEHLLERQAEHDPPKFDVHGRGCLNMCARSPVAHVYTPDGAGAIPELTNEALDEAIAWLDELAAEG